MNRQEVKYINAAEMIRLMRRSWEDKSIREPDPETFEGLLIIDDLGAEARGDSSREKMDFILDYRIRHELHTLITTNLCTSDLASRYARSWSRMTMGMVLTWVADDYRRRSFVKVG